MPGATFSFKSYWNTGTYAAGTYPVTLTITDASGTIIATGTQNLIITNIVKPSAVLKGQISVDTQSVLAGNPVNVTYSVTNNGNADISDVTMSVLIVHVASQTVYGTLTGHAALAMAGTYTSTGTIDTANYDAKDYLVILRANIGGTEETLTGTYFRVEGAPTAPSLASPSNGSDVTVFTPMLSINNASDPNDDKLTYEFELYGDSGLTALVTSSGAMSEGTGVTTWTVPIELTENQTYYWRSRAFDGKLYGPWMAVASFRVNTVNDTPTAPVPTSPVDGGAVDTLTPLLTVTNAADPDSGNLTYNYDVALDPEFVVIAASGIGITSGPGTTSWQVLSGLSENTWYWWRAQADDWFITGPWSQAVKFFISTVNDAPTTPVILTPANNSEVATFSPAIVIQNSTDPDSPVISYYFEIDITATFDSAGIVRSGAVAQGQGSTSWQATGLAENTQYYVRVKASDGQAESAWSSVAGFFVNTVNEPPTAPTLANPSEGSGVNVFTPTLSVHSATDPDRDTLTYEFEVYGDAGMTMLVAGDTGQGTAWTVPTALAENQTYYWRSRAFDGELSGPWIPMASFTVNTANDAPTAPAISSPADGSSLATQTPTLAVTNATDPDSDSLTYGFEIYSGSTLVWSVAGVPENSSGTTAATLNTNLTDNTVYQWRARAFDGDRYGPWTNNASFTVHMPQTGISATIDFDPDTLNRTSNGTWVVAYIELPQGYNAKDINVSSVKLEGTIPAETKPTAVGDHDKDGIPDLMVKFKRSDVIAALNAGEKIPVHISGTLGTVTFEGVDIIRVIK